jgi:hypothetical protein
VLTATIVPEIEWDSVEQIVPNTKEWIMDGANTVSDIELQNRLTEIETVEAGDLAHSALSGAHLAVFSGVCVAITALGILVLAL